MRIEAPLFLLADGQRSCAYPTVGLFYQAIRDAVLANAGAVRAAVAAGGPANQVGGNLGYRTIVPTAGVDPVDELLSAFDLITEQGEGEPVNSIETGKQFQKEQSHYARFAELRYGRRYLAPDPPVELTRDSEPAYFQGDEIAWPVVINTLAVPADGYAALLARDPDAEPVRRDLDAFDAAYTAMMVALDDAWNGPPARSWPSLGEAVIQMNEMRVLSCFNIMRKRVPDDLVAQLSQLYPAEHRLLAEYTDLRRPVFYGPRFANQSNRGGQR